MRNDRRFALGASLLALVLVLGACDSGGGDGNGTPTTPAPTTTAATSPSPTTPAPGEVTVGVSGSFAENQIVAEMYAQVLENTGFTVNRELDILNREASQPAIENGEIDIKPEYLGSMLLFLDAEAVASPNPNDNAGLLRPLLADLGITLLQYSNTNNTNVFVVTQETADQYSLATVSDLVDVAGDLTLSARSECPERPYCIVGLRDVYGVEFGTFQPIDDDATRFLALQSGDVDVALAFGTDAVIGQNNWVVLEDDLDLQTNDAITPVVRTEVLDAFPQIEELLNAVSATLTNEVMIELNGRVQIDQEDAAAVARDHLESVGLLSS